MSQKSVGSFSGTELERSSGWNSYDERGGMDGRVDQGQPPVFIHSIETRTDTPNRGGDKR